MSGAQPQAVRAPAGSLEESQRRNFPRNAACFVIFDSVWTAGCGFVLLAPTVPSYLTALKASGTVMQAATLAIPLLTGLQVWSGAFCSGPNRMRRLFFLFLAFPACWIAYGLVGVLGWGRLPAGAFVPLFVLTCLGLGTVMHLANPAYGELVLRCTPLRWRGRISGLRYVVASLAGLGGVWLAAVLKARWTGMDQFHYAMVVGGSFLTVSCFTIWFVRPPSSEAADARADRPSALGAARGLLRGRRFRVFLVFFGMLTAGQSLAPLIVRHGLKVLEMGQEGFTAASFAGSLGAALVVAPLADRYGFRLLGIMAAAWLAAAMGTMAVGGDPWVSLAAYTLWGGANTLSAVVLANLGAELAPHVAPSTAIAVGTVLALPLSLGVAPLGGWLVDAFGHQGYLAAFASGAVLGLVSLAGFGLAVEEPRTRRRSEVELREA